jgi:hypothetical protein
MIEGSGGDMFDYELEFWRLPSEESLAPNSELKHVLEDAIELFLGNREEKFQYERAIRLFQFQAWVFMPCFETIRWAGLIAATKIARSIEMNEYLPYDGDEPKFDHYPAITMERILELQKKSPAYSRIYNKFIAPWGGLTALLEAPSTMHSFLSGGQPMTCLANGGSLSRASRPRLKPCLVTGTAGMKARSLFTYMKGMASNCCRQRQMLRTRVHL